MKVFGLRGNEYIWLAGCDRRSEWLTKQREEKKTAEMEMDRQSIGVAGEEVLYFIHGYDFENGERCI